MPNAANASSGPGSDFLYLIRLMRKAKAADFSDFFRDRFLKHLLQEPIPGANAPGTGSWSKCSRNLFLEQFPGSQDPRIRPSRSQMRKALIRKAAKPFASFRISFEQASQGICQARRQWAEPIGKSDGIPLENLQNLYFSPNRKIRKSDHRKRTRNGQNHDNRRKWTHMARFGLRIGLFESHSHFQSIADPPGPQIRRKIPKSTLSEQSKNPKIRESAGVGGNGRSPLIVNSRGCRHTTQRSFLREPIRTLGRCMGYFLIWTAF